MKLSESTLLLWLSENLVTTFVFILTLVFVSTLLRDRRSPGSAIAWLVTIIVLPYLGIPLYLLLGSRKITSKLVRKSTIYPPTGFGQTPTTYATMERLLLASGAPGPLAGNQVEVLSDGVAAYSALIELIDRAKCEIHIETFILGRDEVGSTILEHLTRKAREGVQVRLLLDGLGALFVSRGAINRLKAAGGQVSLFAPLFQIPFRAHSNLRNHRKIILIDGAHAMIGGMNLASEYMGPKPSKRRWEDLFLRVRGPVTSCIATIFDADWKFAAQEALPAPVTQTATPTAESIGIAQIVPSGPDVANDSIYDGLLTSIFEAKHRIWIVTPYFIPDDTLSRALELACRRGVDVRILVPRHSDHLLADIGRGSFLRQLEEKGAKILLHKKMVHAKATLVDDRYAIVGSANMDMRSFFLNYEICAFLYSPIEIEKIARWFKSLELNTHEGLPRARFGAHTLEGVGRILSPLL